MGNEAKIDVVIPNITAAFVGTKGTDGFAEVVDDFSNAKEVRILTYSKIGSGNNKYDLKLKDLRTLGPDTELQIIVALPGLKNQKTDGHYNSNRYREDSIVEELGKIKNQIDISQFSCKDVEIYVCFKNHAKLIGTENILYIGSANYSDYSFRNYEAGMVIKDKAVIREIYDRYFDEIVAVRYHADGYDTIRLIVLSIAENLENLKMDIDAFISYFEDRLENVEGMKATYLALLDQVKEVVAQFESCEGVLMENASSDMDEVQNALKDMQTQIFTAFDSGYEKDIEFFADYYEEHHMAKKGVYSTDSWIDEDTLYKLLSEEEEREYYISEYWTEELQNKSEIGELIKIIDDSIKITQNLVHYFNKSPYELFELELVKVGTDENALK